MRSERLRISLVGLSTGRPKTLIGCIRGQGHRILGISPYGEGAVRE